MINKIIKPTSKQTVAAIKSGDFSEVQKKGCRQTERRRCFPGGCVRIRAADLVRLAAGSLSVWGGVRHAVRPAPVNKAKRIFAAVLHGIKKQSDHPDF